MVDGSGTGKAPLCAKVCVVDEDRDDVNLRLGTWEGTWAWVWAGGRGVRRLSCVKSFSLSRLSIDMTGSRQLQRQTWIAWFEARSSLSACPVAVT